MTRLPTTAFIVAGCLALSSCFGAGVIKERRRSMTEFNIEKKVRVIHGGNTGKNPSGREIVATWGEPDRREVKGSDQIWTYDTRGAISGVMVGAYVPLGLMVPSGKDGIDFHFRSNAGTPWRAVERRTGASGSFISAYDGEVFHLVP